MPAILQPVILSGGSGSRLWPMSRAMFPKQLLSMISEQTLLQETVSRLNGLEQQSVDTELADPLVVCNEAHRFFVAEQLLELGKTTSDIILEPIGRNTAPALTLAALSVADKDARTVMLVMPADHVITDITAFHEALLKGISLALQGHLVTFGVKPDRPETGYGYIKMGKSLTGGAATIAAFVEKPDLETAALYLASDEYLWNSGMFMMTAENWLKAIRTLQPEMANCVEQAWQRGERDRDFFRIAEDLFSACPADSIDYAVMEKIIGQPIRELGVAVVPMEVGWSDVGAWSSLWEVAAKDESGNVTRGDVFAHDAENCLIYGESRHIAGIGLKDMVIVETADAVLVADKERAQDVKHAVDWLKEAERDEHLIHRRVYRPWGNYESIDIGERYKVKRITVKPGASLSLQLHQHRAEHWVVVKGTARVTRGDDVFLVTENESTFIPQGVRHRLENLENVPLEIIEVQSGSYLEEDDIIRFDDAYGRKDDKA